MRFDGAFGLYSEQPFTVIDNKTIVRSARTQDVGSLPYIVIFIRLENDCVKLIAGEAEVRTITYPILTLNPKEVKWIRRIKLLGTRRCDLEIIESAHEILELERTLC